MAAFETYGQPDAAWGYAQATVSNGTASHRIGVHLAQFDPNTFAWTTPGGAIPTDGTGIVTTGDYIANPGDLIGSLDNLSIQVMQCYLSSWNIGAWDVYRIDHQLVQRVYVATVGKQENGVWNGGGGLYEGQVTLNFRGGDGLPQKFVMLSTRLDPTGAKINGIAPTNNPLNGVQTYLLGDHNLRGKNGLPFIAARSVTFSVNRRLRRHAGKA